MRNIIRTGAIVASGAGVAASPPDRSLSLASASSQMLNMNYSDFGAINRAKFAFSVWIKRASTGAQCIFDIQKSDGSERVLNIQFNSSNQLIFRASTNGTGYSSAQLTTTAAYTSTSSWYHFLFYYDSANASSDDRLRIWVNGAEVTAFDDENIPSTQVHNPASDTPICLGARALTLDKFNGLIYQPAFFSGTLPLISQVYNAGAAVDVRGVSGLHSLLHTTSSSVLEDDEIKSTNWTNNNSVSKSTTVP